MKPDQYLTRYIPEKDESNPKWLTKVNMSKTQTLHLRRSFSCVKVSHVLGLHCTAGFKIV